MTCLLLVTLSVVVHSMLNAVRLPDPPVFTGVQHFPCICYLPPDSGLCSTYEMRHTVDELIGKDNMMVVRYYFDSVTEQCYPFSVQHCGGNANRFDSLHHCQDFCRKRNKTFHPYSH